MALQKARFGRKRLVTTRTLGAASSANGLSLAVSADGKVAVAGSFNGALDPNNPGNGATTADSFVTLYDNQGQEAWTQTGEAISNNQINSVAFGANDAVYVAGQANFTTDAVTAVGQPKGFMAGYSAAGKADLFTACSGSHGSHQYSRVDGKHRQWILRGPTPATRC